jgi:hypothetical protein
LDEKSIKAMIHKGRALTLLKQFNEAIKQFEEAKQIDSKQGSIIDGNVLMCNYYESK